MDLPLDASMMLSGATTLFTAYFWLVRANRERPALAFVQLSRFLVTSRKNREREGYLRVGFQQRDTGGVLIVNHSSRQNSIIRFTCYLETEEGEITGDWAYSGDDKPPWNVGPETSIAFSPACFFDVPEDIELGDNPSFRLDFITASGRRFSHRFSKFPKYDQEVEENSVRKAA